MTLPVAETSDAVQRSVTKVPRRKWRFYTRLMHRNRPRRHLKPIFLHQIGTARCDRYRRSRPTSNSFKTVMIQWRSLQRAIDMTAREAASAIVRDLRLDRIDA